MPCLWLKEVFIQDSLSTLVQISGNSLIPPNISRCSRACDPFLFCAGISLPGSIPFPPVKHMKSLGFSKSSAKFLLNVQVCS